MNKQNLSYEEAFKVVKAARPCIYPNHGFVLQLKFYESKLANANSASDNPSNP
jgi:hypothetical protein